MSGFKFVKNFDESSDPGVYWRVESMLKHDPIASMYQEQVRQGLAAAVDRLLMKEDGTLKPHRSPYQTRMNVRHRILPVTPLSFFGDKVMDYFTDLVIAALWPAGTGEKDG